MNSDLILEVRDLHVNIYDRNILSNINLDVKKGSILGIIGESGSGKSLLCQAIMRGLSQNTMQLKGQVFYNHIDLMTLSQEKMRGFRGKHIAIIMQNPMTAFDSSQTIEMHFASTLKTHFKMRKKEIREIAIYYLEKVNLPDAKKLLKYYPFQLSGGMLQRVMIALSLTLKPQIIIADEPTTALDTINQKNILKLFHQIKEEMNTTIIVVTHDLGVIAQIADDVAVMYKGEIVEYTNVYDCFDNPQHPYTKKLLASRITR